MTNDPFEPKMRALTLGELQDIEKMPGFEDWLEDIDAALLREINQWWGMSRWYEYYNTPSGFTDHLPFREINPREFLYYWKSLSDEEEFAHQLYTPLEVLMGELY